jgi:hypothetical protein
MAASAQRQRISGNKSKRLSDGREAGKTISYKHSE